MLKDHDTTMSVRSGVLSLICVSALVLTGCVGAGSGGSAPPPSADDSTQEAPDSSEESSDNDSTSDELALPDDFPDDFPLPEGYMIVRVSEGDLDSMGRYIEVNIAVDGSVEESIDYFDEALRNVYGEVEANPAEGSFDSHSFEFRPGGGFEVGRLLVDENDGSLDMGDNDSSDLPVLLFIGLEERES